MRISKVSGMIASLALVGTVTLAGPSASASTTLTAGGSSFAGNIMQTCAAGYTADNVTYASTGSGAGRTNFANGTYDFGASDSAYKSTDPQPAKFTYVPLLGGPIAIAYNVPGVAALKLTPALLGNIFSGKVTKWNDPAIRKINAGVRLPNDTINVIFRSDKSGTTENFADYLRESGARGWKTDGTWATASGQSKPVGIGAAQNQGVVAELKKTTYSIGYSDLADINSKGLPFASLRNAAGEFVRPSVGASAKFLAVQKIASNGIVDLNFKAKVKGGYNATLLTYAMAPTATSSKGPAIRKFLNFVVDKCSPANGPKKGYVALTGAFKTKALALVRTVK
jgi:phosphate transport system substrate-binding protein